MSVREYVVCHGIPAIRATARGAAFIVRDAGDWKSVPQGAIAISSTASPNCIFAMESAAGFVFETGGPASHAAILARECGKACVVGARGVLAASSHGCAVVILATGEVRLHA